MTPDELKEAVARAIHSQWVKNNATPKDHHEYRDYDELIDVEKDDLLKEARAAIAVCMEQAARVADGFRCGICGMDGQAAAAIRALIGKEPQA